MRRLGLIGLFAVALAGCSGEPDAGPGITTPTADQIEANVKKIEADPNMTPQAKEAAIAAVRSAQEKMQSDASAVPAGKH
ncbi:hypothetical protein EON81_10865 [bacterium]|nr:MAG: hypothetical protein EON81_10865 [bacterium]